MNFVYLIAAFFCGLALAAFSLPLFKLFWVVLGATDPSYYDLGYFTQVAFFTCEQAIASSLISGIVGSLLAFLCIEMELPGRKIISNLSNIAFFLPPLLVALALVGVWGNRGWVGRFLPQSMLYGWFGILLGHLFFNFSVYFKLVGQALVENRKIEEKIALSLGANRSVVFRTITLPKLKGPILQSFVLVFIYCLSSFVILLLLGGGPKFTGFEVAIYQAIKVDLNLKLATSLAGIQLLFCFVAHQAVGWSSELRSKYPTKAVSAIYHCRSRLTRIALAGVTWLLFSALILLPITSLIASGLRSIHKLEIIEIGEVLRLSLWLGVKVALVSSWIAFCAAYLIRHSRTLRVKKIISFLSLMPVVVSNMVFGIALMIFFPSLKHWGGEHLWGVVFIQALSALPLNFRILNEKFSKIDREIYWSAKSLGASYFQLLTLVELPMLKKAVASSLATGIGISLGEVGALLLFESQGQLTFSIWLFKLMGKYQFGEAHAVGILLLLVMGSIFLIKEIWER